MQRKQIRLEYTSNVVLPFPFESSPPSRASPSCAVTPVGQKTWKATVQTGEPGKEGKSTEELKPGWKATSRCRECRRGRASGPILYKMDKHEYLKSFVAYINKEMQLAKGILAHSSWFCQTTYHDHYVTNARHTFIQYCEVLQTRLRDNIPAEKIDKTK